MSQLYKDLAILYVIMVLLIKLLNVIVKGEIQNAPLFEQGLSVAGSETGREKEGTEGGQISSGGKQKGGGGEGAMEEVLFRSQPRGRY